MTRWSDRPMKLLAIQFYDQLFVHWHLYLIAFRQRDHPSSVRVAIDFQPVWRVLMAGKFLRRLQDRQFTAIFTDCDLVSRAHLERGDVYLASVDLNVAVPYQLPRLAA